MTTTPQNNKPLLQAYTGQPADRTPIWLMRQAGRYLPEYRAIRQRSGSFLDLVYTSDLAAEITVQPIRRFGMDGAILFSDILVIPHALGQKVQFIEERGPVLEPIRSVNDLSRLNFTHFDTVLNPVYETVRLTRAQLDREGFQRTTLIGFSGSPWTLACYMVEGGTSREFHNVKSWAYADPDGFGRLMDILVEAIIAYCNRQVDAGAEAIQLFESWAGILDHTLFSRFVINPTRRIIEGIRAVHPAIPIVGFPRGAGRLGLDYAHHTGLNVIALDSQITPANAAEIFQRQWTVQGNMDPVCLLNGGAAMENAVDDIMHNLSGGPFVFNLGHGVIKETPPDHVEKLVNLVRDWRAS